MGKHRTKSPDYCCEDEAQRGSRTEKIPKGRLPQVWEPKTLDNADGRFGVIKALKEKVERLKQDAGADSFQKELLCERAGFLVAILETIEVRAIEENKLDAGSYVQAINALVGILRHLGLKKASRSISLSEYVERKSKSQ